MSDPVAKRGEVWLAQLDKVRPVVILQRDPLGQLLDKIIGVPITSRLRDLSTEVPLGPDDGVRVGSVANLDTLTSIPRSRLLRRIGRVRAVTLEAMCGALAIAVDCER